VIRAGDADEADNILGERRVELHRAAREGHAE